MMYIIVAGLIGIAFVAFVVFVFIHYTKSIVVGANVRTLGIIQLSQVGGLGDYRKLFTEVNNKSKELRSKYSLAMTSGDKNVIYQVAPYHFQAAYANLTEVERDNFAADPEKLKCMEKIIKDYNDAYWVGDFANTARAIANYYRLILGEPDRGKAEFYLSPLILNILNNVRSALSTKEVFLAHVLISETENRYVEMSDLDIIVTMYIRGRLEAMIQSNRYPVRTDMISNYIVGLELLINRLIGSVGDPSYILANVPSKINGITMESAA